MAQTKKKVKMRTVSAKLPKPKPSSTDPVAKMILGHFDDELKNEFATFLQERAKVVPISRAKKKVKKIVKGKVVKGKAVKKEKTEYKKEGVEPMSFKELTSYKNPLFSAPGKWNPAEVNPETIDVETFTSMRRNYQIAIGLAIIKMPIIALPYRVICDDMKIQKTVEWMLAKIWKKLVKNALMAVDYGFASHEKVWERGTVKISEKDKAGKEEIYYQGDIVFYKKIKPHHPESIKMKFDDKQNLVEIIQESSLGGFKEIELPIRKCFLFTNEEEFGNPFGVSRLKNAYTVWYYQNLLLQFMMQYFERRGTPPTVATAPPGRTQDSGGAEVDNLDIALRLATSLISSSVAVLPYQANREGRENMWKLDTFSDDARAPMFIDALTHLEALSLRALFIPEGVISSGESGGSGSNSLSADMFLMTEKGLITDFEDAVSEQICTPFVEANYPPEEQRPVSVKLDPLSFERKTTVKELFIEMMRNIDTMLQIGAPPDIMPSLSKMAQILELPVESFEDATGLSKEEFREIFKESNSSAGVEESAIDPKTDKPKIKVGVKKKPRATSVNQTQDRKRSNPTSKRSARKRDPLSRTKEN